MNDDRCVTDCHIPIIFTKKIQDRFGKVEPL